MGHKYLFFDTETTGLPKSMNAPLADVDNWPRIVQIAWVLIDAEGNEATNGKQYIIRPDGFIVPEEATRIHGISHAQAMRKGKPLRQVLERFMKDVSRVDEIVAHNIDFDRGVVGCELFRVGLGSGSLGPANIRCTMHESTVYCAIPRSNGSGNKWPNLSELHETLFGQKYDGAHIALNDVRACARCFMELKRRGVM